MLWAEVNRVDSIWSKTAGLPPFPALAEDITTDVAVIGGGMAGMLTVYLLTRRGLDAVVLEAGHVGGGQTKNTTAKITSQHRLIYGRLTRESGRETAKRYADANEQAVAAYRRIVSERAVDCDFEDAPAFLYSTRSEDASRLEEEASAARDLGIRAEFTEKTALPFPVAGAVRFPEQAQFHPLKFLRGIANGLTVFEQTRVTDVRGNLVVTDGGTVRAKSVVFATHFPFLNVPGYYFARMHQERSYVLALENAARSGGMYLGLGPDGLSFRSAGGLLLLGGGGHRTGENSAGGKYEALRRKAKELYPQATEAARWSAQDCITPDGVPYIGRFSASTPDWYVATGFNKWGMTGSMVSAMLLRDLITGRENPAEAVFSPQRLPPPASAEALLRDGAQSVKGLSRRIFSPPRAELEALPTGRGGVVEADGEKAGVYKEENGETHLVSVRCPHLGCQLEWNPDEKSWDCPCHGSRFDFTGKLIDGPAQRGLEKDE